MQRDESGGKIFFLSERAKIYNIATLARWSVKSTLVRLFCCIRKLHNPPCIIHSRIAKCTAAETTLGDVVSRRGVRVGVELFSHSQRRMMFPLSVSHYPSYMYIPSLWLLN